MADLDKTVEETLRRAARIEGKTDDVIKLLADDDPERGPSPLETMLEELLVGQMRAKQGEIAIAGTLRAVMKELELIKAELAVLSGRE